MFAYHVSSMSLPANLLDTFAEMVRQGAVPLGSNDLSLLITSVTVLVFLWCPPGPLLYALGPIRGKLGGERLD